MGVSRGGANFSKVWVDLAETGFEAASAVQEDPLVGSNWMP